MLKDFYYRQFSAKKESFITLWFKIVLDLLC